MESSERIKAAGLKVTPQRKAVYEVMQKLHHASMEMILEGLQSRADDMTASTVYRILGSFCKSGVLSFTCHPETAKCYYDITPSEHHHLFAGDRIDDYDDAELSQLIRRCLERHRFPTERIRKIEVRITLESEEQTT